MIDEITITGFTIILLVLLHYMTNGASDWLSNLYIILFIIAICMYVIEKIINVGSDILQKIDDGVYNV